MTANRVHRSVLFVVPLLLLTLSCGAKDIRAFNGFQWLQLDKVQRSAIVSGYVFALEMIRQVYGLDQSMLEDAGLLDTEMVVIASEVTAFYLRNPLNLTVPVWEAMIARRLGRLKGDKNGTQDREEQERPPPPTFDVPRRTDI